jgi:hypothetical protein
MVLVGVGPQPGEFLRRFIAVSKKSTKSSRWVNQPHTVTAVNLKYTPNVFLIVASKHYKY